MKMFKVMYDIYKKDFKTKLFDFYDPKNIKTETNEQGTFIKMPNTIYIPIVVKDFRKIQH